MTITPQQQLDNLTRWRDELASGRWQKCECAQSSESGGRCAYGVALEVFWLTELTHVARFIAIDELTGFDAVLVIGVILANDLNPGDNFTAVIEYLNEEITRRKMALGVLVAEEAQVFA